jgi:hypothetical protein
MAINNKMENENIQIIFNGIGFVFLLFIFAYTSYYTESQINDIENKIDNIGRSITELGYDLDDDYYKHLNSSGIYKPSKKEIVVFGNRIGSTKDVLGTSHHETGHYNWYEQMTDVQRKEWNEIYNKTNVYVSDYSKTNVREDYAEVFMTAIKCEFDLDSVPQDRRELFKETVKGYNGK